MHHQSIVAHRVDPPEGEAVAGGVLPQRRDEVFGHALLLHSEKPYDVETWQDVIKIVAHLHRPPLERGREQSRRRDERYLGSKRCVDKHVRASYAAVLHIAHDADVHAVERATLFTNRVAVQQRLGGVLVPTVASVDHVDSIAQPTRDLPGHTCGAMADHDGVDTHGLDGEDCVSERLTLLD